MAKGNRCKAKEKKENTCVYFDLNSKCAFKRDIEIHIY
jgi:hypothetical protein